MIFSQPQAAIFIPDRQSLPGALSRTTHLGIGAHADDLEFMAFHGIVSCYEKSDQWFTGVTCTDGVGSVRSGGYAQCTDEQMRETRRAEQNQAAQIGRYGAMIQLGHSSASVCHPQGSDLRDDLLRILQATRPGIVYTHNVADKHATHIGVAVAAIQALRLLPVEQRPEKVHGCEVWRDLDWLPDGEKILLDVSGHDDLATALHGVFASQIAGGKRYDLGVMGRRRAHATFQEAHAADRAESLTLAMDLTPLLCDETLDIAGYVDGLIGHFRADVLSKLRDRDL